MARARVKKTAARKPTQKSSQKATKTPRRKPEAWDGPVAPPPEKPKPKKARKKAAKPPRETKDQRKIRERKERYAAARQAREIPAAAGADLTAGKQGAPDHLKAHQFQPGQSGNPKGRPKGARSKLAEDFIRDVADAWEANGREAIADAMLESPIGFVKMVAGIIPQEVDHRFKDLEDMSDDEIDARIARGVALIGGTIGGAPRAGAPAGGKAAQDRA